MHRLRKLNLLTRGSLFHLFSLLGGDSATTASTSLFGPLDAAKFSCEAPLLKEWVESCAWLLLLLRPKWPVTAWAAVMNQGILPCGLTVPIIRIVVRC